MEHPRLRKPTVHQPHHSRPAQVMLLATAAQDLPPEPSHPIAEYAEAFRVSRYRVVVEVALDDRAKPLPGKRHWFMHSLAELLFDYCQLGPHSFADRFAF